MDIENLIAVFERKLMLQRYSAGSIKNYSSSVRSFLQVAEKRFDQPDELNENEIEKYVYRKIRKDNISNSYVMVASIDKFYNSAIPIVGRCFVNTQMCAHIFGKQEPFVGTISLFPLTVITQMLR